MTVDYHLKYTVKKQFAALMPRAWYYVRLQSEASRQPLLPDWPAAAEHWRTGHSRERRLADGAKGWSDTRHYWTRSDGDGKPYEASGAWLWWWDVMRVWGRWGRTIRRDKGRRRNKSEHRGRNRRRRGRWRNGHIKLKTDEKLRKLSKTLTTEQEI